MKKNVAVIIIVILLGSGIWIYVPSHMTDKETAAKPVIKIGVTLPLTGDLAYVGEALKGAIEIAREDLFKKDLKNDYEFIIESNAFDNKQILAVNAKFAYQDRVDAIVSFTTQVGLLTSPVATQNKILHFNACASGKDVADGEYNFLHTTLPDKEAALFAGTIAPRYRNIALIVWNEVSAVLSAGYLKSEFDKIAVKHTTTLVNPKETNVRILIDKVERTKPDAYLILMVTPTFEIFYRQLREKGIKTPITSTHYMENTTDLFPEEGTEYIAYPQPDETILERIMAHNKPRTDYSVCLGNLYDIVMMLAMAFENSYSTAEAAMHLRKLTEYDGVMGHVTQEAGIFQAMPVRKIIRNGEPVIIK